MRPRRHPLRSAILAFALLAPCAQAADEAGESWRVLDAFDVGDDVYVRSLMVDGNDLWVGTSAGVLRVDLVSQRPLDTFTRADGLANEYVFAIGRDRDDHVWFGTNAGGASRYRDGRWQVFFPMHGLADYWVYAFAQQPDGDFWIGTWAGANRVDLDTLEFTTYLPELVNEWVYGIAVDSRERVWFGTEGGVSVLDGESWRHWTHEDGLGASNASTLPHSPNTGLGTRDRHDLDVRVDGRGSYNANYVFAIHAAADDVVWAGTWGGGVSRFEDGRWRNYTREDGLSGDIVYSIAEDADGALWFGTNRGVSRLADGRWSRYGREQGLPADDVYAIDTGAGGDVWAGMRGAVVRLGRPARPESPHPADGGER